MFSFTWPMLGTRPGEAAIRHTDNKVTTKTINKRLRILLFIFFSIVHGCAQPLTGRGYQTTLNLAFFGPLQRRNRVAGKLNLHVFRYPKLNAVIFESHYRTV